METKQNPEKVNSAKHIKTKLPWFSRLLWHSAWKWGGLILQCSQPTQGKRQYSYVKLKKLISVLSSVNGNDFKIIM